MCITFILLELLDLYRHAMCIWHSWLLWQYHDNFCFHDSMMIISVSMAISSLFKFSWQYNHHFSFHVNIIIISISMTISLSFQNPCQYHHHFSFHGNIIITSISMAISSSFQFPCQYHHFSFHINIIIISVSTSISSSFQFPWQYHVLSNLTMTYFILSSVTYLLPYSVLILLCLIETICLEAVEPVTSQNQQIIFCR